MSLGHQCHIIMACHTPHLGPSRHLMMKRAAEAQKRPPLGLARHVPVGRPPLPVQHHRHGAHQASRGAVVRVDRGAIHRPAGSIGAGCCPARHPFHPIRRHNAAARGGGPTPGSAHAGGRGPVRRCDKSPQHPVRRPPPRIGLAPARLSGGGSLLSPVLQQFAPAAGSRSTRAPLRGGR